VPDGVCGTGGNPITVGAAAANILALEHTYQSSYPFTPTLQNGGYIGSLVAQGLGVGTNAVPLTFGPNFQTPRSFQMNVGFQHEIRHQLVLSMDFVRNVETHSLLGVDVNHTGDAHFFNQAGAQAAIAQTITDCGASSLANALAAGGCTPLEPAAIGAQMSDFAARGLTATYELGAYNPSNPSPTSCPIAGCAFWGVNRGVSSNLNFLLPISRSVYNAVDVKLVQTISTPFRGIKSGSFQFSYSLSKFVNPGGANPVAQPGNYQQGADQDFVIGAADNANPLRYMGPSTLDRRHQFSFGGSFALPKGFQTGIIAHFYSPLSTPLVVPNSGLGDGEIFRTDFTGDGTTQDFVPGTKNGAFMRNVNPGNLVSVINNYNHTFAGQATPAGQELIATGLFTLQQLQQANGVAPILPVPIANAVGLAWLKDIDLSFGWKYVIKEKVTIQPGVSFFNTFNFANFDLPPNVLSPYLTGQQGNVGGTNYAGTQNVRVCAGTGVYGLGAPRVAEFNLNITF